MFRHAMKAVVFVATCFMSWAFLTPLRAKLVLHPPQQVAASSSQQNALAIASVPGVGTKQLAKDAVPPPNLFTPEPSFYAHLEEFRADVVEGRVQVSMQTRIKEHKPGFSYLWSARIFSPDRQELLRVHYNDQIFVPAVGEEQTPTFHDTFDMPPGRNRIVVGLYRFPDHGAEAVHGSLDDALPFNLLQGFKVVPMP